jgi:hypothetical protein
MVTIMDDNYQEMLSQLSKSWEDLDFQSILELNKENLDNNLVFEIGELIKNIKSVEIHSFTHIQQTIVLLNYIYSDLKDGDLSEVNTNFLKIKQYILNLRK